jgi:hypothetical protein
VYDSLKGWTWNIQNYMELDIGDGSSHKFGKCLDSVTVIDCVVLLPTADVDGETVVLSEFTMVTKEWSPAMLEHFELANTGMDIKVRMGEHMI